MELIYILRHKLSFVELRFLGTKLDETSAPDLLQYLLPHFLQHVADGNNWSEFQISGVSSEIDYRVLMVRCHQNRIIEDIKNLLARNQYAPLNCIDAQDLEALMDEADAWHINWNKLHISRNVLLFIIKSAYKGYKHINSKKAKRNWLIRLFQAIFGFCHKFVGNSFAGLYSPARSG